MLVAEARRRPPYNLDEGGGAPARGMPEPEPELELQPEPQPEPEGPSMVRSTVRGRCVLQAAHFWS